MKVLLIRHGETSWNSSKKFQGNRDVTLNKVGRMQAHTTGKFLKENHNDSDAIFTSDLARAYETSLIINNYLNTKLFLRKKLKEININLWGGKTYEYIKDKYKRQFNNWQINPNYKLPGLESHYEIKKRVKNEIIRIISKNAGLNKIVIVSHGMAIRSFLVGFYEKYDLNDLEIKNCSITDLNYIEGEFFLENINYHNHFYFV